VRSDKKVCVEGKKEETAVGRKGKRRMMTGDAGQCPVS
jgi:hypothetical protein